MSTGQWEADPGWEVDPERALWAAGRPGGLGDVLLAALNPDGSRPLAMRHGKVVSFSATTWTATVTVGGSSVQVPGVPHLEGYQLAANDPVWLVKYGPGYMVLGSPAAAWRAPSGILSLTTLAANSASIGDVYWATSSAGLATTDRRVRLVAAGRFQPPAAGTGISLLFERSVGGGAWSTVGFTPVFIAPTGGLQGFHYEFVDTPPAGSTQYRVRAAAANANGQVISTNSQFVVEDVGSAA